MIGSGRESAFQSVASPLLEHSVSSSPGSASAVQYVREGAPIDVHCALPGPPTPKSTLPGGPAAESEASVDYAAAGGGGGLLQRTVHWQFNGSALAMGLGAGAEAAAEVANGGGVGVLRIRAFRAARHAGVYVCVAHEPALPGPVVGASTLLAPARMHLLAFALYGLDSLE